jgi:putative ABC transport system permease protein
MLIRLAMRNLLRNPRRTVAVLLTIAAGTGSLFLFHGFNTGIMNQYRDNTIHARFGHGQVNTRGYRDQAFPAPWEHWIADWQAVCDRLRKAPGVEFLFPRLGFAALLSNGRVTVSGRGEAIDGAEESRFFTTLNVIEGATLAGQPDGILVGRGLARALEAHPGGKLTVLVQDARGGLERAELTVAGVFHTGLREIDDTLFRIPLTHGQQLVGTDRVELIALGLRSVADWDGVQKVIDEEFPSLEAAPFAVLDKVYYQHSVDWLAAQFAVIRLIILVIVVLGIFNTVSVSVLERRQEIGNLRANGESVAEVMWLLALEGAALGVLGAALGIAIALGVDATIPASRASSACRSSSSPRRRCSPSSSGPQRPSLPPPWPAPAWRGCRSQKPCAPHEADRERQNRMSENGSNTPYRVLSLDGGGIRGFYTAALLSRLGRHYAGASRGGSASPDLGTRFDLVCGNSAGAILACSLAAGVPLDRIADFFRRDGPAIFPRPSPIGWRNLWWCLRHWRAPSADARALRAALERTFGTETLAALHRRRGIALCLATTDLERCRLRILRTPHRSPHDGDMALVEACMASSAAPILFAPIRHGPDAGESSEGELLCDGGVSVNNPLMIALREALGTSGEGREIRLLSVGTCGPFPRERSGNRRRRALGYWINGLRVIQLSLDVQSQAAVDDARALAPLLAHPTRVVRLLDPPVSPAKADVLRIDNAVPEAFEMLDTLAETAAALNIRKEEEGDADLALLPDFFRAAPAAAR